MEQSIGKDIEVPSLNPGKTDSISWAEMFRTVMTDRRKIVQMHI